MENPELLVGLRYPRTFATLQLTRPFSKPTTVSNLNVPLVLVHLPRGPVSAYFLPTVFLNSITLNFKGTELAPFWIFSISVPKSLKRLMRGRSSDLIRSPYSPCCREDAFIMKVNSSTLGNHAWNLVNYCLLYSNPLLM
jgi:hypothetical protein